MNRDFIKGMGDGSEIASFAFMSHHGINALIIKSLVFLFFQDLIFLIFIFFELINAFLNIRTILGQKSSQSLRLYPFKKLVFSFRYGFITDNFHIFRCEASI